MKLHLPSSLRKALLSCIAAFSSILPSTVASGSSLLAAGAAASIFFAQHQAFGEFTGPDIQWDTDSRVEINGTNAKADLSENEGTNLWLGVWGSTAVADNISVYNGLGKNLRLTKIGAASSSILSKEGKHLDVTTLYLEASAGGANTRYDINQASYLTSNIQNIYIDTVALYITGTHTGLVTNFSLGTTSGRNTGFGNNANFSPLSIGATVTTTGYLEVQESTILLLQNEAGAFTVGSLQGKEDADLTLISKHDNNYLLLSNGGENFRGKINFKIYGGNDDQYNKTSEIRLGEGSTLNVKGITGERAKFTAASGTATLNITGSDAANTVDQISFSNITVNLADGARQTFTNADLSTSLVLGENSVLGLGGVVTLNSAGISAADSSTINFTTGTLKLQGSGSISQLNIGNADSTATLELQSGATTVNTLTLNGAVDLNVLLSNQPSLNVTTLAGNNKTVHVSLADDILTGLQGGQTLKLFGDAGVSSIALTWDGDVTFGRQTVRFDTGTATFTVEGNHAELEYTGADAFTWNTETSNTPWHNGGGGQDYFCSGDYVTLGAAGGDNTERAVTLAGELKAGSITVQSGTWNLSGGNLSSASTHIEQGATIGITANTTFAPGALSGGGTIHYQGGTLTLNDASAFTGTLHLTSNFETPNGLTFAPGGKITTDGAGSRLTINGTFTGDVEYTATVGMQTSTTVFNAGAHLKGTLKLGKQSYLNFGNNVRIDCVDMSSSPDTHDFGTWQATNSVGYIGTLVRVSTFKLQGPDSGARYIHLTGDFNGETSTIDRTFALDQNSGGAAGHLYFDGKVSNLISISNNLNRSGDINKDGKVYFTGGIEVSNEFSLIGKGDKVQFIIQSDLTGNGNLIKTEKGKLIIEGGDHSKYEGSLTINNSVGGEDAATISTNLTSLRELNVMEGNTLTITGSSATVGAAAVSIEGTVALTNGATLDFKGPGEGSIGQGHITGGSTETLSVSGGKLTADITGYTGRVEATGGYAELQGTYNTAAVLTATAGQMALVGGFDQGTHRNVSVEEEALLLLKGATIGKGATAIITANGNEATVNIDEVQLTSGGVLHVQAGDGAIITGRAAAHYDDVELQILATGAKATMKGLTLQSGEVLGFAEDAGAIGPRSIILSGVTLRGGSTLGFDVLEAEDPTEGWITGSALTGYKVEDTLTLDTKTEQIKIALDPYMRMNTGDIGVLKEGTYVLIEGIGSAGMSEEEKEALLNNFAQATVPLERLAYALNIDDAGNLIVEVISSDNAVEWASAAGGVWNTDADNMCWSMSRTPSYFMRGDSVTFGTQRNATDVVQIEVQHGATEKEQVTVSGITVKGSTSYRIDGDIYGYNVDGIADKGLQVGTASEAFTGTLTLNGNNAWYGDNTISSGTVEALTPLALSNVTTRLTGGELQLNYEDGATFAGTLVFTGGALTALQSAEANATIGDATLNAATDATLTVHRMEGSTAGALRINYNMADAGEVRLVFDTAAAGASALQVSGGDFTLINASGAEEAAFNVAGAVTLSNKSTVHVSSGITLSGNMQATGGSIELETGSALRDTAVNGAIAALVSHGATLTGGKEGIGTTVELLEIHGKTTMSGNWEVHALVHEYGDITIADGTTTITPAEDTQAVDIIKVQNGATLRGGNEAAKLMLRSLELGSAPEEGAETAEAAAKLAAGSNITATEVSIANGTVAKDASLTIADGGHATVSGAGSSIAGRLILDGAENGAELTISDEAALTGELLILGGQATISSDKAAGYITLGSADATLDMTDVAASSTISMVADAQLLRTGGFTGTIIVDDRQGVGAFALGGITSGASVQLLNLQGKSYVSGIAEGLNLTGASLISLSNSQRDRQNALIRFADESSTGAYEQKENATLTIDVSGIASTVTKAGSKGVTYYVFNKGVQGNCWNAAHTIFQAELALYQMDVSFSSLDGSLTLTYTGPMGGVDIYVASEDNENGEIAVKDYDSMDGYAGIVLDNKTRVDLTGKRLDEEHPDGLVLKNLSGTSEGELTILGDGTGQTLVTISNTITDDQIDAFIHDHPGLENIENIFTVAGNVSVNESDLRIKHISDDDELLTSSRTRMAGALTIEGGELQLVSGELELAGGADVQDVTFSGTNGQLVINACTAAMSNIRVEELEPGEGAHTEHIRIENAGHLQLKTGTQVGEHIIIGNVAAEPQELAGYVNVSGKSTMGQSVELHRVALDLAEGSRLSVSSAAAQPLVRAIAEVEEEEPSTGAWNLAGMSGKGELSTAAARDIDFTVAGEDHVFSGSLASYHGVMTFGASDYTQVFSGVVGGDDWNVTNKTDGRIKLDLMGGERHTNTLNMGDLTLQSGSITTIVADLLTLGNERHGLHVNELSIEDGATVTISQYDEGLVTIEGDGIIRLGTLTGEDTKWDNVNWQLEGVRNVTSVVGYSENGEFYLKAAVDNTNLYTKYADNENSAAGAKMLWSVENSAQYGDDSDLAKLDSTAYSLLAGDAWKTPGNVDKANKLLAAAAGAGTAALGEALSSDVERQLRAVRNRTTNLSYSEKSKSAAWLNAEANYHKQSGDGLLPGYKLNGWGGTVGAHTTVGNAATVGLALTAMYNDVESNDADRIKGDMDNHYLSGFAQVAHGAWRHTFVATVGTASVDVNRTVSHEGGSYTTKGSTDGYAFGMLYEVGYTIPLKSDYSLCLQPVFNVAWRSGSLDSYTENGSDAALNVAEQSYNTITFGLGARLQAAVGANAWNRTGLLEARALVKADAGDRQGEVETSFAKVPGSATGHLKSAERGAVGVELGAGVTVPTGASGAVFADFSAELRTDYTNFNVTAGYKINF